MASLVACRRLTPIRQKSLGERADGFKNNAALMVKLQEANGAFCDVLVGGAKPVRREAVLTHADSRPITLLYERELRPSNFSPLCGCSDPSDLEEEEEEEDGCSTSIGTRIPSNLSFALLPSDHEQPGDGPLDSLSSIADALPLKRGGLSKFFSGKSQSFSSLAGVSSVAELAKPENPFVKRRRTTAASPFGCKGAKSAPPLLMNFMIQGSAQAFTDTELRASARVTQQLSSLSSANL